MRALRKAVYGSSEDEGRALFERSPVVHLATVGDEAQPILRVLHGVMIGAGGSGDLLIAFHGAPAGEKLEGIGKKAVMMVHETVAEIPSWFLDPDRACPATTYYLSAQADGVLEEIGNDQIELKAEILQTIMTKYQPEGRHVPIRATDPLYTKAVKGLLVAGLRVTCIVCKAKLGQNRKPEERTRIIENLWRRGATRDVRAVDMLVRRFPDLAPSFLRSPQQHGANGLRFDCSMHAHEEDEVIALLEDAYWLVGLSRDVRLDAIRASQAIVMARDDRTNELIGFARAVSDGKVAWIYDVMVKDGIRKSGAGTSIMKLLLDHPVVRGVRAVRLTTRDAMAFYERLGFVDTRETSWRPWPVVEMIKLTRSERAGQAQAAEA